MLLMQKVHSDSHLNISAPHNEANTHSLVATREPAIMARQIVDDLPPI